MSLNNHRQKVVHHHHNRLDAHLVEHGDQSLGEPEREDKLRASHEELGRQALEEGGDTFILDHVGDNTHATLRVLEVAVLDTGLDDIEGSRDDEGSSSTGNRGDEVLSPGGLVVVLDAEGLLSEGGTTEELEIR